MSEQVSNTGSGKEATLMELLGEYMAHLKSRNFSPVTIKTGRNTITSDLAWLRDSPGVILPSRLRASHLENWFRHTSSATTCNGHPRKARTVNKHIEQMRGFIRYLARKGYVSTHMVEFINYVKEPQVLPGSVLRHSQARKIIESVPTDTPGGYRTRTMLELLYTSGIRAGELAGLDVGHVDMRNATAMVTGKGGKDRVVPVGRTALMFLGNYIRGVRPFLLKDPQEKALFLDKHGKRMPYYTFRRIIKDVARGTGISVDVTAHTFRRSCTTELLRGGAGMYHVKELLGHESLDTLKHYAKLTITDLKKEHQRCHPREKDGEQNPEKTGNSRRL